MCSKWVWPSFCITNHNITNKFIMYLVYLEICHPWYWNMTKQIIFFSQTHCSPQQIKIFLLYVPILKNILNIWTGRLYIQYLVTQNRQNETYYTCNYTVVRTYVHWLIKNMTVPEGLLVASIVSNVLPLGVDAIEVDLLTIQCHTVISILVCK